MNFIKLFKIIKNKILYGVKCDSETYIRYLRSLGMCIGKNTIIYDPPNTLIDETRPWLINIGDNVKITYGVTILTHGYDWSVLKGVYGEVLGSGGSVCIGNNVFIGIRSVILKNVHIGNNVIIGANSLVNKDIPDNSVVAGNPCKVIMNLQDYYEKRKKEQVKEATEIVQSYREHYGKEPDKKVLREHFWLFSDDPNQLPTVWKSVNQLCGNELFTNAQMKRHVKQYENMTDFLNSIPWDCNRKR